jgi:hypothetical protein
MTGEVTLNDLIAAGVLGAAFAGPGIEGKGGTLGSGLNAANQEVELLARARASRDALAAELAPQGGRAPATVTSGYNVRTGEVAARACGNSMCAESHVVEALGGVKEEVRFTEAIRPRTGAEVPICPNCEATFGRDVFPPGTSFKTDNLPKKGN